MVLIVNFEFSPLHFHIPHPVLRFIIAVVEVKSPLHKIHYFNHFWVYNSGISKGPTMLYNPLVPEHFITPKTNPVPLAFILHSSLPAASANRSSALWIQFCGWWCTPFGNSSWEGLQVMNFGSPHVWKCLLLSLRLSRESKVHTIPPLSTSEMLSHWLVCIYVLITVRAILHSGSSVPGLYTRWPI